jgi:lipopolysaccharide biosynthesis glycosyltransferase
VAASRARHPLNDTAEEQFMDIAFNFDAAYAPHVPAVIESVLDHHPARGLRLWLMVDPDVPDVAKAAIVAGVGRRAAVAFLEDHELDVAALPASTKGEFAYCSRASYRRLRLPHVLPAEVTRVLYLDIDVLCLGPLDELFTADLGDNIVAAVRDPYALRLCDMDGMPGLADGVVPDPQAPYFNGGMMLIDVPAWLAADVTPRSLDYIRRYREQTRFLEQDALNAVLFGRWLRVNKKWNHTRTSRLESVAGGRLGQAAIAHTIGPVKLWDRAFPEGDRKALYGAYARRA